MADMGGEPFCAGVDWGTSSFRIWLLSADGTVLAERRAAEGLLQVAAGGFEPVLESHLAALGASADLPVVACGMVGARQGWVEAPYLSAPAPLSDLAATAIRVPGAQRDIRILPGVAVRDPARPDVMRGEETQLAGLQATEGRVLACLPGTHAKWALLEGGQLLGFSTFMTGEIFDLLVKSSILRHTLSGSANVTGDDPDFHAAARAAFEAPAQWTSELFRIRAGDVLNLTRERNMSAWLSGTLLGVELAGAAERHRFESPIRLVASGRLAELYAGAMTACGVAFRPVDADETVRRGLLTAALSFWTSKTEGTAA